MRVILGERVEKVLKTSLDLTYVGVKSPQFSYTRLRGAFPRLGVEMGSTGEVACLGDTIHEALLKSLLSTGFEIPHKAILVSVSNDKDKFKLLEAVRLLTKMGFCLYATANTRRFYAEHDLKMELLHKIHEDKQPNIREYLMEKKLDLVIHIDDPQTHYHHDGPYLLRRTAIDYSVPLVQNIQLARTLIDALYLKPELHIKSWGEY